jgi:hypothetical protein
MITVYLGPIGLLPYVLANKEPRTGTHEEFITPLWKQGIGSTIHLVGRDVPHHITNNNVETKGGGGLMLVIEVEP